MRDHFMAAMKAEPGNDALRRVFADWLEERGDPLAEFIRLQLDLEPLRVPCSDLMAELERHKRLERIPPGKDRREEDWRIARQFKRERELLRLHQQDWLGEIAALEQRYDAYFEPEFRRGFVSSAQIGLTSLREHGAILRRDCPLLQCLIVFGTLTHGDELADVPTLAGLPHLTVAGWLNESDATALKMSPYLAKLQTLTFWLGIQHDFDAARHVAELPALTELILVQMWGGISANNAAELDQRAETLVEQVKQLRPGLSVRLERPFARRFPIDGVHIGHGLYGGTFPHNQAVLVSVVEGDIDLLFFNAEGHLERVEKVQVGRKLLRSSWKWDWTTEPIMGFRPGPVFVREFSAAGVGLCCWSDDLQDVLLNPYSLYGPNPLSEPEEAARDLYHWATTSQFRLPYGNDYWADGLGRVHSS